MSTVLPDLRYAIRSLYKSPGFAVVAALTLAIGVGANTAVFSVLHAVVLKELPYHEPERLALLWTLSIPRNLPDGSSYLTFRDWKQQSHEFEDMTLYRRPGSTRSTIARGQSAERVYVTLVGPDFFRVLGSPALLGRTLEPTDFSTGHHVVVISHSLWRQHFGGQATAIGRSITVDDTACEIVAVMPADFEFPNGDIQVWRPASVMPTWQAIQHDERTRDGDGFMVIGRLRAGATLQSARAELDTIAARLRTAYPEANAGDGVWIEPLLDHVIGARTGRSLWLLLGAVGFVLMIACANVANLVLARGASRRHELALRTALGASTLRLIWHALAESLVLAAVAAPGGILLAWLVVSALRMWTAAAVPRLKTLELDGTVLLFAFAVSIICGVVAGLLPALHLSKMNPVKALAGGGRTLTARESRRFRDGLVIAELALAVILLSGAGLFLRSFARLQGVDRGFDRNLLLLQVDLPDTYNSAESRAGYYAEVFQRIRSLPGVAAAGAVTDFFIHERNADSRISVEGRPRQPGEPDPPLIRDNIIPGYFEAVRIPLLRGRLLRDGDLVADAPAAGVINEAMARWFWPGEDPVGKRLKWSSNPSADVPWITVVGVVADAKRRNLDEPAIPAMFQAGVSRQMDIVVRTVGDPGTLREAIRAELRGLDPAAPPFGVITVEERLGDTVAVRTLQTLLLAALAITALVLAVIGVYGLVHQTVLVRTQEIGVRMALGASRSSVLRMVWSDALGLAAAGLLVGLSGALLLARTLSSFLYETSPLDPVTYATVAVLLIVVTTLACLTPARRAARLDPMSALRHH